MSEARETAMAALRQEFAEIVSAMCERLTPSADGKQKVFRNSLVGNFQEFFEGFLNRNVFEDAELTELVNRAKSVLNGTDPETLRSSPLHAESIRTSMSEVKESILKAIQDRPGRKISI